MNLRCSVVQSSVFVSHHNVVWVEWLFWAALFQIMTQEHRGFCPVAWPSQSSLSPALCMGKKEQRKANPLLATPDQNHASSFSFMSPKAIIQASVWYDRKLGPGVFPFPTVLMPRSTHESKSPYWLSVVNLSRLAATIPLLSVCDYSVCRALGALQDELICCTCGYTAVLFPWMRASRIATLRASNYDSCSASVSLRLGFLCVHYHARSLHVQVTVS